jgi:tetrahydromethanopterin S-methyltransferase subunit G
VTVGEDKHFCVGCFIGVLFGFVIALVLVIEKII